MSWGHWSDFLFAFPHPWGYTLSFSSKILISFPCNWPVGCRGRDLTPPFNTCCFSVNSSDCFTKACSRVRKDSVNFSRSKKVLCSVLTPAVRSSVFQFWLRYCVFGYSPNLSKLARFSLTCVSVQRTQSACFCAHLEIMLYVLSHPLLQQ